MSLLAVSSIKQSENYCQHWCSFHSHLALHIMLLSII